MRTTLALIESLEYTGSGTNFAPGQITRRGLNVDRLLPLHGRIVPLADLHRAIGRTP